MGIVKFCLPTDLKILNSTPFVMQTDKKKVKSLVMRQQTLAVVVFALCAVSSAGSYFRHHGACMYQDHHGENLPTVTHSRAQRKNQAAKRRHAFVQKT